jgi:hypothetical protein
MFKWPEQWTITTSQCQWSGRNRSNIRTPSLFDYQLKTAVKFVLQWKIIKSQSQWSRRKASNNWFRTIHSNSRTSFFVCASIEDDFAVSVTVEDVPKKCEHQLIWINSQQQLSVIFVRASIENDFQICYSWRWPCHSVSDHEEMRATVYLHQVLATVELFYYSGTWPCHSVSGFNAATRQSKIEHGQTFRAWTTNEATPERPSTRSARHPYDCWFSGTSVTPIQRINLGSCIVASHAGCSSTSSIIRNSANRDLAYNRCTEDRPIWHSPVSLIDTASVSGIIYSSFKPLISRIMRKKLPSGVTTSVATEQAGKVQTDRIPNRICSTLIDEWTPADG